MLEENIENNKNKCDKEKDIDTKLKDLEEKQSYLIEESNGNHKWFTQRKPMHIKLVLRKPIDLICIGLIHTLFAY